MSRTSGANRSRRRQLVFDQLELLTTSPCNRTRMPSLSVAGARRRRTSRERPIRRRADGRSVVRTIQLPIAAHSQRSMASRRCTRNRRCCCRKPPPTIRRHVGARRPVDRRRASAAWDRQRSSSSMRRQGAAAQSCHRVTAETSHRHGCHRPSFCLPRTAAESHSTSIRLIWKRARYVD